MNQFFLVVVELYNLTCVYRAVSQFFAAFENNRNFGQKVLTGTDFRSRFVKMALSHNITVFRFSLVDIDSLSFLTMELYGGQLLKI